VINHYFRKTQIVAKFNLSQSSACWSEYGEQVATHWDLPILVSYWTSVFGFINKMLQVSLPRDLLISILGVKPPDLIKKNWEVSVLYLLWMLLVLCILLHRRTSQLNGFRKCLRHLRNAYGLWGKCMWWKK